MGFVAHRSRGLVMIEGLARARRASAVVTFVTALAAAVAVAAPAQASRRDTTPPTAPFLAYAQGYHCGVLIVGMDRSTDNVTPQSQLRYEVFVDGAPFGPAVDRGSESGVWAWFQGVPPDPVLQPGSHVVTVKAQDAAGNWSAPSRSWPVTGYPC
jgi:hypothetical protein